MQYNKTDKDKGMFLGNVPIIGHSEQNCPAPPAGFTEMSQTLYCNPEQEYV